MKLLINTFIIIALSAIAQLFLPWWSIAVVAFLVGYFATDSGWQAFGAGFLALVMLWGGYSLFIDQANEHILSSKMAQLFKLPSSYLLIIITSIIGGIVAGLSALSGRLIKGLM
jgi:cell division protein FtsX